MTTKTTIGWREWVALPELGIEHIKAKVDTGARTSALHTFELALVRQDAADWVEFSVHPLQRDTSAVMCCRAPLKDRRVVRDSGGHEEERLVIQTRLMLGGDSSLIEITLTSRDNMGFRMLLGRTAMRSSYLVDPAKSYLIGKRR